MTTLLTETSPRPAPLPFEKVSGNVWPDDYEDECGLWRHPASLPAEGPIWLYIKMDALPGDCAGPHGHKWMASLVGVSPFFATNASVCSALESCGDYLADCWDDLDPAKREMALCEALVSYGVYCPVVHKTSGRAKGAFKGCAQEAVFPTMMWGVVADRTVNAVGSGGWDFLRGELGFGGERKCKPSPFQKKVLAWLNRFYAGRAEYQKESRG